ncbi:glycosyltransferase family 2 protein [Muricauda sp. MAR_2010_75]|uniref:glycosyltransferase family 2 protein n=1 Tax=Allomuricauda sp. MAR_2010_75 TaxID=1250232 RepID=UPI00056A2C88|nr:glycosyltransferase family 2 protein [Muricauda sp. MAR_2010_75]
MEPGEITYGVSVILNIYKRPYFEEQIEAILSQSLPVENVIIIHNEDYIEIPEDIKTSIKSRHSNLYFIESEFNLKYFARFHIAASLETPFVYIIDDDVIPTPGWIERCYHACIELGAIISGTGRCLEDGCYSVADSKISTDTFVGDMINPKFNCIRDLTQVDYACSSYFFRREWLDYFFRYTPLMLNNGEDIHLSASCMVAAGIPTFVLPQNEFDSSNIRIHYGGDSMATWKKNKFFAQRKDIIKYWIQEHGWIPLRWTKDKIVV